MVMIPYSKQAYDLFHRGTIALGRVESNGIKIDTEYLDRAIRKMRRKIKYMQEEIEQSDVVKVWRKKYRNKFNIGSNDQLGDILFNEMGHECPATTGTGKFKTDEKTLASVDSPFVKKYLRIKKFQKALSTNLVGLKKEVVNGYVHPFFDLSTVRTYRSSSSAINFQNQPIRDKEIMKIVRRCFIPRPGNHLIEEDYGGIEVGVAACYHKDPVMLEYIKDETKDMHRDMAAQCFKLRVEEITKEIRYCGKNMFVFPQFYGDYYIRCAASLWEAITRLKLETASGVPLREHLKSQGIKKLGKLDPRERPKKGTYERHIKNVEKDFWNNRFSVYNEWKQEWYEEYQRRGWLKSLTGFICQGYMKRNEVINYPVQGSAFHCLLWSLIQIQDELKKRKMKSLIVGQIHDSIVSDVPPEEKDEYLEITHKIMAKDLMDEWDWIIVPLETESEIVPVGGSWADKEKIK